MTLSVVNGREIDSQVLTLAASGWTYEFTFVLFDYETQSLWFPFLNEDGDNQLTCIAGYYRDKKLPAYQAVNTRWSTWREMHPDTKYFKGGDFPNVGE